MSCMSSKKARNPVDARLCFRKCRCPLRDVANVSPIALLFARRRYAIGALSPSPKVPRSPLHLIPLAVATESLPLCSAHLISRLLPLSSIAGISLSVSTVVPASLADGLTGFSSVIRSGVVPPLCPVPSSETSLRFPCVYFPHIRLSNHLLRSATDVVGPNRVR
jgi:hypothetical protein